MQQAHDFLEECDVLAKLLEQLPAGDYDRATLFKAWSVNDILVHLHFWNKAADLALNNAEAFSVLYDDLKDSLAKGTLRAFENAHIKERGRELYELWQNHYRKMAREWAGVDPKQRVKWAGPEMSTRSSMSARQMETWAHGQAVFDLLGADRPETDRIRNIVFLGINAFGWSHKVHGLAVPEAMPKLELVSPSGDIWEFGEESIGCITGTAVEFCQVVAQTRNILDTTLKLKGKVATTWMNNAQCFAGPAELPPAPGSRVKS